MAIMRDRPDAAANAGELVAQGHALIRIENETMMQVAVQRPRDEGAVIKGALQELELVPEEAGKAFYSIPYNDRQTGKVTKVEGPSVKAAMALARRWGNCSTGARVLNEDKEGFDVEGVFIDLETNFRITRPQRVSKWFKPRAGGMQQLSVDRQLMAVQAGASKAIRNAILAGLPAYLVSAYDRKARAIVAGKLDAPADAKTIKAVLDAFAKWSVTKEQLESYAELPTDKWTGTQIADLRGLWNAVNDGQTTIAEVFAGPQSEAAQPAGPSEATVRPESLAGATVTAEDGAHPGGGAEAHPSPASSVGAEATERSAAPLQGDLVDRAVASGADLERSVLIGRLQAKLDKLGAKKAAPILEKLGITNLDRTDQAVLDDLARELEK